MTKTKSPPRKPRQVAKTESTSTAESETKPAVQTKAASRSAPDETPDELLDRGEKSKRTADREAALAKSAAE